MTAAPLPTAGRRRAGALLGMALLVLVATTLSAAISWRAVQDILWRRTVATWPVVTATITGSRIEHHHEPRAGKRSPWTAWCVSFDYSYPWQGGRHGDTLPDDTTSPYAPGCFLYEERARQATAHRPVGSTLTVRVDPADPWRTTAASVDIPTSDVVWLAIGAVPLLLVAQGLVNLFGRHRQASRSS